MRPDHVLSALVGLAWISRVSMLGRFTALTGDSPVVAVGDTAVLHCHTSIPAELLEVRWIRIQDGNYSIINLFRDGKDQQRCDLLEYVGRTELVKDGLARGRVALKVFNVSVADEGTYRCYLQTNYYFDFTDLKLSAKALGSNPRIDIEGVQDGGVKAVCRSAGWYPRPVLVNKEDDGEMEIRQEDNGLYSIEYSRIITENSNRTFSCRLQTLRPHQERESSIHVTDGLFRKSADLTVYTVLAAIAFALGAAVGAVFCFWNRQRNKRGNKQRNNPGAASAGDPVPLYLEVRLEEGSSNMLTDPDCGLSG